MALVMFQVTRLQVKEMSLEQQVRGATSVK
jgi:hypothetical protein